ncbi:malonyl-CoA decarboxylase domain-containing protein [Thermodesulfobacteriota bacterium]
MLKPNRTRDRAKAGDEKKVTGVLNEFGKLNEDNIREDEVFKNIKLHYEALDDAEKDDLFQRIIKEIEVSKGAIETLLKSLDDCEPDDPSWPVSLSELRRRIYSPRLSLLRKISHCPGGLRFLLDFRGDLLSVQRFSEADLKPLDDDIVLLFEQWFQDGFLYLEEVTHDSPYRQIELIKNSDLVHPMTSIEEMGQRLGKDRRCFALYHRLIPYEPIIFIEVALSRGIIKNINEIIEKTGRQQQQREIDTAVFYSINNTQNGLAGLGLGKVLIGQVVTYLKQENDQIKNFSTLSPLPGFWNNYLKPILEGNDDAFALKQEDVSSFFSKRQVAYILTSAGQDKAAAEQFTHALLSILSDEGWVEKEELKKNLQTPLTRVAFHYIAREKNLQSKPLNPVAGFHLGNEATVAEKNVNFFANPSPKGINESCGIMVNYIYTTNWLGQIRRSFRLLDKMEIKGIFRRQ